MPSFLLSIDHRIFLMNISKFVVIFDGLYRGEFQQYRMFNAIRNKLLEKSSLLGLKEKIYFPLAEYPYVVPYYFQRKGDNLKKYVLEELNSGFNKSNLIVFYNSLNFCKRANLIDAIKLQLNNYGCYLLITMRPCVFIEKNSKLQINIIFTSNDSKINRQE